MIIDIGRRQFISALGGASVAWPLAARAQQFNQIRRIGALMPWDADDKEGQSRLAAFQQGLATLGWMEGRNIRTEVRWGAGGLDRLRTSAAELVALAPEVILANSAASTFALRGETHSVPIVFTMVPDPIGGGLVASLAKPGGNITGFTSLEPIMGSKLVELLKEIAPRITRVAIIFNPETASYAEILQSVETASRSFTVDPISAPVHNVTEIEDTIASHARESGGGLIVLPDAFTSTHRELIVLLAVQHRLPSIYPYRYFVTSGGLMSYGVDANDILRRSAFYIDRILKGDKPGDLPVQQPAKFELIVNLQVARALGLTVSPMLLSRADEVIE
jgi:putative tryptophan/tyrosine transport system substrate-binding protein